MDFQFDATADGRILTFLNVIDEYSRFCLAIRVGRRCKKIVPAGGKGHSSRSGGPVVGIYRAKY
jgi:hypothetical protein